LAATPDLFAFDPTHGQGVIQIKSVEPGVFREQWRDADGNVVAPNYVAIQAMVEAHVTGAQWAAAAAVVVSYGIELHIVDVAIDAAIIERIRSETVRFWDSIARDQKPEPDFKADGKMILRMLGQDDGTELDLTGDNELPDIVARR